MVGVLGGATGTRRPVSGARLRAGEAPGLAVRLAPIATIAGLFALDLNLRSAGFPPHLPLATAAWAAIALAWAAPALVALEPESCLVRAPPGAVVWFGGFVAFGVASAAWSVQPARTAIVAALSGLAFLGAFAVTRRFGWYRFVALASVGLGLFLALGLARDAVQHNLVSAIPEVWSGQRRMAGLAYSATDLGRTAAFGLVFALVAARRARGRARAVHLGFAAVAVAAQISSNTRLITFGLAALALVAFIRWRLAAALGAVVVATAVMVAAVADPERAVDLVGRQGEQTAHVLEIGGRVPVWEHALSVWEQRPVAGHGWGTNQALFREATIDDALDFEAYTAHNMVLAVGVETGIVGVTLLFGGLGALWRGAGRVASGAVLFALVLLTGLTEATLVRPSVVFAVLGALAALPPGGPAIRRRIDAHT